MEPILKIALITLGFFLIHSLLVAEGFKARVSRIIGERAMVRWYDKAYTAISVITLVPCLWLIWRMDNVFLFRPPKPIAWAMHAIQAGGMLFAAVSYIQLKQSGMATRGDDPILMRGGYGIVRNPLYFAGIVGMLFEPNFTRNWLVVRVLSIAYLVWGAYIEERRFLKRHGDSYRDYMRQVPLLIPRPGDLMRWMLGRQRG